MPNQGGNRGTDHPRILIVEDDPAVVSAHGLAVEPFNDLISAFDQDQRVTRYQTWEELLGYCRLSANPVGRIVLRLGGVTEAHPDHARILAVVIAVPVGFCARG